MSTQPEHAGNVAPPVYVIILNWNGWADTVECLESVARLDYPRCRTIVCDNGSSDDSLERIKAWAEGRLDVVPAPADPVRGLCHPPAPKPISYVSYDRESAERGGIATECAPLVLIQTGANLGFGGGNNVGLRYALARGDFAYVWLLNNDTVVHPRALRALVATAAQDDRVGLCGSTLLYYHEPLLVQALGGASFNRWLARPRHLGEGQPVGAPVDAIAARRRMAYVVGASMLVSQAFLRTVGLMAEDYFLYYEEIDWAERGRSKFSLGYAQESVVYHKEGAATQSARRRHKTNAIADFYVNHNRLIFARRHAPRTLPTVILGLLVVFVKSILRGRWQRAAMLLRPSFWVSRGKSPTPR